MKNPIPSQPYILDTILSDLENCVHENISYKVSKDKNQISAFVGVGIDIYQFIWLFVNLQYLFHVFRCLTF